MKNVKVEVRGPEAICEKVKTLVENGHADTVSAIWINAQKCMARTITRACLIGIGVTVLASFTVALINKHRNKIQYEVES